MNNSLELLTKLKDPRTNWKYILVVVIVALIVGGGILGYYWSAMKQKVKAPEVKIPEKATEGKTANWKTYRNEEYGYEIKYPQIGKLSLEKKRQCFYISKEKIACSI